MLRKWLSLLLMLALLPLTGASGQGYLAMMVAPNEFIPGETLHIYFTVHQAGVVNLMVQDAAGNVQAILLQEEEMRAGSSEVAWDGMVESRPISNGVYTVRLTMQDMSVDMAVTVGGGEQEVSVQATAVTDPEMQPVKEPTVEPIAVPVMTSGSSITPAHRSDYTPQPHHEGCYWCTPMDIRDEAAVWAMLTAPMTIVEGDNQKAQVILRAEPSDDAEGVGVVTCISQGVHVLETRDDGWSLVETVSSSFHDSKVMAWNLFVRGYIKTNRLKEKKPNQQYGLIVDKLTQELYIFKDGKLFSTLLASTGLYNDTQPYNETRAGEFLIVSRTGEFRSDNMFCSMALRFNSGDLIHEVPHVKNRDGTKNYKNTEPKLGTRASHGCIRIQRLRNAQGVNMTWVWNNIKTNTKMVIWEDYQGRSIPLPDSALPLYYNADGGSSYHSTEKCNGVRDEYLPLRGQFTYGELEQENYAKLTRCAYCIPPLRVQEIESINEVHKTESPGDVPQHLRKKK